MFSLATRSELRSCRRPEGHSQFPLAALADLLGVAVGAFCERDKACGGGLFFCLFPSSYTNCAPSKFAVSKWSRGQVFGEILSLYSNGSPLFTVISAPILPIRIRFAPYFGLNTITEGKLHKKTPFTRSLTYSLIHNQQPASFSFSFLLK